MANPVKQISNYKMFLILFFIPFIFERNLKFRLSNNVIVHLIQSCHFTTMDFESNLAFSVIPVVELDKSTFWVQKPYLPH